MLSFLQVHPRSLRLLLDGVRGSHIVYFSATYIKHHMDSPRFVKLDVFAVIESHMYYIHTIHTYTQPLPSLLLLPTHHHPRPHVDPPQRSEWTSETSGKHRGISKLTLYTPTDKPVPRDRKEKSSQFVKSKKIREDGNAQRRAYTSIHHANSKQN
jgi:hypothetical protein